MGRGDGDSPILLYQIRVILEARDKVRIGVVGAGFGASFYFHLHPNSQVVAVAAHQYDERQRLQATYKCPKAYSSLKELLQDAEVDAVALFTPAPMHAEHTVQTLAAGKHVLCAVPVGLTVDECARVKHAVHQTGLIYMMAETSVYRQDTITARQLYQCGEMGRLIGAEASYHHPGLEEYFFDSSGEPTWRHGLPPMLYATHCTAFFIRVTDERLTSVSCVGWGDGDAILADNPYNNTFWNEIALFTSEKGTPFKANISWKGSLLPTERCEWYGEQMSFYSKEPRGIEATIIRQASIRGTDDAGFLTHQQIIEPHEQKLWWQTDLLPTSLRMDSGHFGSHTFLTHEFVDAIMSARKPEIDIEQAINYTLPGIIAHESALKGGEQLPILGYESL